MSGGNGGIRDVYLRFGYDKRAFLNQPPFFPFFRWQTEGSINLMTIIPKQPNDLSALSHKQRQQRRQLERIEKAWEARKRGEQLLGFCVRDFVLCGLPYKRPKGRAYKRQNGAFLFKVQADEDYGLPFGQDRLIPIWLASAFQAAGQPEDNVIRFRSASDILRAFGLPINGQERQLLRERMERVFGATFTMEVEQPIAGARRLTRSSPAVYVGKRRYHLISKLDLWYSHEDTTNQYTLWQNTIELEPHFAEDLRRQILPIDLDTVRALKRSPAVLDLYIWQAWRSYRLKVQGRNASLRVPLFGESGLMAQGGSGTSEVFKQKQLLRRWHQRVREVWEGCPNELTPDTEWLILRPASAVQKHAKLELPGVCKHPPLPKRSPEELPDFQAVLEAQRQAKLLGPLTDPGRLLMVRPPDGELPDQNFPEDDL